MTAVAWSQHPLAGISFPAAVGTFIRTGVHQYDDWGHDLSAGYTSPAGSPDTKLMVYVSPAGAASDAYQMQRTLDEIYQVQPAAQTLAHSRVVIDGREGLRVDLRFPTASGGGVVPSSVVLFKEDGWFIKVRATAPEAPPERACGDSAEDLMRFLGWPDTSRRLDAALRTAVARSKESMENLKRACDDVATEAGVLMRCVLEDLEGGALLDATERYLEMGEKGEQQAAIVESALRAYLPAGVTFTGGFGAAPWTPVIVGNTSTDGECVAACHRYVDCIAGTSGERWPAKRCDVLVAGDRLLDAVSVIGPLGQSLVLFFKVNGPSPASGLSGVTVLGSVEWPPSADGSSLGVVDELPEGLHHAFLIEHLGNHHAQFLVGQL